MKIIPVDGNPGLFRDMDTGKIFNLGANMNRLDASLQQHIIVLLEARILVTQAKEKVLRMPYIPQMPRVQDVAEQMNVVDQLIEDIIMWMRKVGS